MYSDEQLANPFKIEGLQIVGQIVRGENPADIYVQIQSSVKADGAKSPSRTQLAVLVRQFQVMGLELHPLLVNADREKFEELLRATLFFAFPDQLRNIFCSITSMRVSVWVEPKQPLSPALRASISKAAQKFCESQEFELEQFVAAGEAETPGKTAILAALRQIAPATLKDLRRTLDARNFTVPSEDWLSRKMDTYRKAHDVVFTLDKRYALTADTLKAIGTSKIGKKSLDVSRLLALWKASR